MKLISIPKNNFEDYRLDLLFDAYKWDPQFLDNGTVAKQVLVITEDEYKLLKKYTEELDKETIAAEEFLNHNQKLAKLLYLPKSISRQMKTMVNYDPDIHIRLTRYDFHPTIDNTWAVSEVNSDVPGGFAEATLMPEIAKKYLSNSIDVSNFWYTKFGDLLVEAISNKVVTGGKIMLVHCTSFSDDRQVMQYIGDRLSKHGFKVIYGAADHIHFSEKMAFSILSGNSVKLDGIFRFTPIEWLKDIKPIFWNGYFDTITPSCNHPIAVFAQTKRFPLIWNLLEEQGLSFKTWRKLLPETIEVKDVNPRNKDEYIFKPACGRVGEKISIKEACVGDEYKKILNDVRKHQKNYLAQKKFISKPILSDSNEEFHLCLGSYAIEGKHAGFYARISKTPRIDSNAADIPVLIERRK